MLVAMAVSVSKFTHGDCVLCAGDSLARHLDMLCFGLTFTVVTCHTLVSDFRFFIRNLAAARKVAVERRSKEHQ